MSRIKYVLFCGGSLVCFGDAYAVDIKTGPIRNQRHAEETCPKVCAYNKKEWNGHWSTIASGSESICNCIPLHPSVTDPSSTPVSGESQPKAEYAQINAQIIAKIGLTIQTLNVSTKDKLIDSLKEIIAMSKDFISRLSEDITSRFPSLGPIPEINSVHNGISFLQERIGALEKTNVKNMSGILQKLNLQTLNLLKDRLTAIHSPNIIENNLYIDKIVKDHKERLKKEYRARIASNKVESDRIKKLKSINPFH